MQRVFNESWNICFDIDIDAVAMNWPDPECSGERWRHNSGSSHSDFVLLQLQKCETRVKLGSKSRLASLARMAWTVVFVLWCWWVLSLWTCWCNLGCPTDSSDWRVVPSEGDDTCSVCVNLLSFFKHKQLKIETLKNFELKTTVVTEMPVMTVSSY